MTAFANSDAICIQELEFEARVGVPDEERAKPQGLVVSLTLWPHTRFDRLHDELARTVDYGAVARAVEEFARERADKLIETLADEIARHLLESFPIRRVQIELRKFVLPNAKHVAVRLTRDSTSGD